MIGQKTEKTIDKFKRELKLCVDYRNEKRLKVFCVLGKYYVLIQEWLISELRPLIKHLHLQFSSECNLLVERTHFRQNGAEMSDKSA